MQPTHHNESSMYNEAYRGDMIKLINEAYKGNVFELVMRYNTATHRPGCSLSDTVNFAQQIEAMMRQTPVIDTDEIIDEEEEVPDALCHQSFEFSNYKSFWWEC
jgi:hypothetical protein